jgi:hypothetical protein
MLLALCLTSRTSWLLTVSGQKQKQAAEASFQSTARQRAARQRYCSQHSSGGGEAATDSVAAGGQGSSSNATTNSSSVAQARRSLAMGKGKLRLRSREAVTWQEIDRLINEPARVFGRQRKAGLPADFRAAMDHMVNMDPWMPVGLPPKAGHNMSDWLNTTAR